MVYNLAPILSMVSVLMLWAVARLRAIDAGCGLEHRRALLDRGGRIGTLSIIMAGWSSNNRYALLGAFRQVAVLVSFEIPMVAVLLIPTIFAGSMGMNAIIQRQESDYGVLAAGSHHLYYLQAITSCGRTPFDLMEAESELVSGYETSEYSGMKSACSTR